MAPRKENLTTNNEGWTNYQQLVLSELKRNTLKLDALEKEVVDMRLANARLESDNENSEETLKEILVELKSIESRMDTKIKELNAAREQMIAEINLVKWKLGTAVTAASTAMVIIFQAIVKFFLPF